MAETLAMPASLPVCGRLLLEGTRTKCRQPPTNAMMAARNGK